VVVDVAIGMIFIYLVFSVAASRLSEFISTRLQLRYRGLLRGISGLLEGERHGRRPADPAPAGGSAGGSGADSVGGTGDGAVRLTTAAVINHPVIVGLSAGLGGKRKPSYLPSRAFATAVLDLLAPPVEAMLDDARLELLTMNDTPAAVRQEVSRLLDAALVEPGKDRLGALVETMPDGMPSKAALAAYAADPTRPILDRVRTAVAGLPPDYPAKRAILRMLADAGGDADRLRDSLERWYDDAMARMGGWYKRHVQALLLALGFVLAIGFNVDTVNVAQVLWRVPAERVAVAAAAGSHAGTNVGAVDTTVRGISALNLPIGWTAPHAPAPAAGVSRLSSDPRRVPWSLGSILEKVLGLGLTTVALSFGATFWFDALGKLSGLRDTGAKPATTAPAPLPLPLPAPAAPVSSTAGSVPTQSSPPQSSPAAG
jgi:hypothetical protein